MAVGINLPDLPPLNLLQVNTGLQPDDGLGDTWLTAFTKHNENMEKLALFAQQTINHLNGLEGRVGTLEGDVDRLQAIVAGLELIINDLRNQLPVDLSDILRRLAAIESRLNQLPSSTYRLLPYSVLGFGRPLPADTRVLGFGIAGNNATHRAVGYLLNEVLIRVLMYNHEWKVNGQDERVNTGDNVTWYIFFSEKVRVASVFNITFTNQYTGSAQPAAVSNQVISALDGNGAVIAQYSNTTTYPIGAIVSDIADVSSPNAVWYRSLTVNNTGNDLSNATHWQQVTSQGRWHLYKVVATCTSASGERKVKLGFPPNAVIEENLDQTGRNVTLPCLDRGEITVVAA